MRFSIIIPALNEEHAIGATLQTLQPLRGQAEIILVDGGSSDATRARAAPLVDRLLNSPRGRARQMNRGAEHAGGEVLIFLHADTRLPPEALTAIDAALVRSPWGRFDIQLEGAHFMFPIIAQMMNWRSCLTGIATGDQVIFCTAELFRQIGGYPDIALMEDLALSRRLKRIHRPACLRAKVVSSGRRWEQFGVFKTILLMWSLQLRYFFGQNPDTLAILYREGKFWTTSSDSASL